MREPFYGGPDLHSGGWRPARLSSFARAPSRVRRSRRRSSCSPPRSRSSSSASTTRPRWASRSARRTPVARAPTALSPRRRSPLGRRSGGPEWRPPSFLGRSDFGALSALALGIGFAALVFAARRLGWFPVVLGALGVVLAGATAGLIGVAAGTVGLLYAAWRRRRLGLRDVALCGTVVAVVTAGVFTLRAGDYDQFLRFLHIRRAEHAQRVGVET